MNRADVLPGRSPTVDAETSSPPTTRTVRLGGGRRLAIDRYGHTGPAILALHGIPGWRGTFARVAARLGRDHRVYVPDLLGFGDSDDAPPQSHAREQADAVASVLDEMLDEIGSDGAHLVGFDFGGPVAVRLAGTHRAKVRSLSLMATNLFPDTPVPAPLRVAKVPLLGPLFYRGAFGRQGLTLMWRFATGDRRAFPLERYRRAFRGSGVRSTREIFLASMRDLPGLYTDVERIGRGLELPALVLWGEHDPFFPVAVGRRTAEAMDAEFHVLEGCGHFVPEERPDRVASEIRDLVRRSGG